MGDVVSHPFRSGLLGLGLVDPAEAHQGDGPAVAGDRIVGFESDRPIEMCRVAAKSPRRIFGSASSLGTAGSLGSRAIAVRGGGSRRPRRRSPSGCGRHPDDLRRNRVRGPDRLRIRLRPPRCGGPCQLVGEAEPGPGEIRVPSSRFVIMVHKGARSYPTIGGGSPPARGTAWDHRAIRGPGARSPWPPGRCHRFPDRSSPALGKLRVGPLRDDERPSEQRLGLGVPAQLGGDQAPQQVPFVWNRPRVSPGFSASTAPAISRPEGDPALVKLGLGRVGLSFEPAVQRRLRLGEPARLDVADHREYVGEPARDRPRPSTWRWSTQPRPGRRQARVSAAVFA